MEVASITYPFTKPGTGIASYPSYKEIAEIAGKFGVEVLHYIPGGRFENGFLRLKFPNSQCEEGLIKAINEVLEQRRLVIVKNDLP